MKMRSIIKSITVFAALAFVTCGLYAAEAAAGVEASVEKQTLFQKLNMPTVWMLVLFSIGCVWLLIDTIIKTNLKKMVPQEQREAMREFFRTGNYTGALEYCRNNPSLFTNVVATGLKMAADGKDAAEEAMNAQIARESNAFNNKASFLSITGVVGPMIGLTGTVFGMIDAFSAMGSTGSADPAKLSAAIGAVLYATASGLVVAIPAFVAFFYLRGKINGSMLVLQDEISRLFRRMPYEEFATVLFEGDEIYASKPSWDAQASSQTDAIQEAQQ